MFAFAQRNSELPPQAEERVKKISMNPDPKVFAAIFPNRSRNFSVYISIVVAPKTQSEGKTTQIQDLILNTMMKKKRRTINCGVDMGIFGENDNGKRPPSIRPNNVQSTCDHPL